MTFFACNKLSYVTNSVRQPITIYVDFFFTLQDLETEEEIITLHKSILYFRSYEFFFSFFFF